MRQSFTVRFFIPSWDEGPPIAPNPQYSNLQLVISIFSTSLIFIANSSIWWIYKFFRIISLDSSPRIPIASLNQLFSSTVELSWVISRLSIKMYSLPERSKPVIKLFDPFIITSLFFSPIILTHLSSSPELGWIISR